MGTLEKVSADPLSPAIVGQRSRTRRAISTVVGMGIEGGAIVGYGVGGTVRGIGAGLYNAYRGVTGQSF